VSHILGHPVVRRRHRRGRLPLLFGGAVATVAVLLVGVWWGGHPSALPSPLRTSILESRRPEFVTQQALNILTSRYYRPLDRSTLVDLALSGMVSGLHDPYSRYIDPSSYAASMDQSDEHMTGIGISVVGEPEGLRIINVVDTAPAAHAGLVRGDVIVKVGATPLAGRGDDYGLDLLRGPVGTTVTLTVLRGHTERVVSVPREQFVVPIAGARMIDRDGVRIGYLRLTSFDEGANQELRADVQRTLSEGAEGFILDLRGNGGGLINEAIDVASIFLARGTIMSALERGQSRRVYSARGDALAASAPLVVLVDHGTASSAEIVTAALQDHARAKVIGTQTHGKGLFQQTQPLSNGGALDLTIGEFFTPDGRNLGETAGVTPNIYAPDDARNPNDEPLAVAERTVTAELR
jgi:carboxyl-terminal processing protease